MEYLKEKRKQKVAELKQMENDILKKWEEPGSDIIDLMNKMNRIIDIDDALLEEYEDTISEYKQSEKTREVFDSIIPAIQEIVDVEIVTLRLNFKIIKIKDPADEDIMKIIELLKNNTLLNENASWGIEYEKKTNMYKIEIKIDVCD